MKFRSRALSIFLVFLAMFGLQAKSGLCEDGMRSLGEICRVKGQETNTLQGWGLVTGLRGTGDSDSSATSMALSRMIQLMGGPIGLERNGQLDVKALGETKNVAMVFVTAQVPRFGAQQGDLVDVTVTAISAKSLEGGVLMLTPLLGPRADNPTVYAMAQGELRLGLDGPATKATIESGAKMEATVKTAFEAHGKITFVIKDDVASFETAQLIQSQINVYLDQLPSLANSPAAQRLLIQPGGEASYARTQASNGKFARAVDQKHVEVLIPPSFANNVVGFISQLESQVRITLRSQSQRVVINEREGIVVIGEGVEIAPSLISHRNLRILAGGGPTLVAVDPQANPTLQSLADALNALEVPTEDLIAIIKTLQKKGDLFGEVVFE
ncbi:MAG: flagellar biosynthesis protein FlgI [Saprospirales bacterium TMED214]|nr:MAG: flagellar biosynthesis protein FlgI [Saprospirales bacterium TMED214]